jgi:hypothetical protein
MRHNIVNDVMKACVIAAFAFFMGFLAVTIGECVSCERESYAHGSELEVFRAVQLLQPAHPPAVAAAWAGVLFEAGVETDIDPLLLTAIAFRESSLRTSVVGDRGEVGPMQLHGAALAHRPSGCDPAEMSCSIRGGAAVLQWWQAQCSGSWSVWVGAYGLGRCPSEEDAEALGSVRRARALYERIGGRSWQ